jgi:hypothetical protein
MADVVIAESETANGSAVSWPAIVAGGITTASLTIVLLAFGAGMGFSSVSPWSNSGVSSGTFQVASGVYLIVVAMLASTIGGYIAGRLRTKWSGLESGEVLFRDTAHGFLAWAFAAVLGATVLGAAATYALGGVATGAVQGAAQSAVSPADYYVDLLLRPPSSTRVAVPVQSPGDQAAPRREIGIILAHAVGQGAEISSNDRTYLTQLVAARSGIPADADRWVSDVISQAKVAADHARKAAAAFSMWLTASMLIGAFAASLAAIEGGQLRDGTWKGVIGGRSDLRGRTT